jgi:predicted nucleic acid-binding protein
VLLLDNSAWSRIVQNLLDEQRTAEVAQWLGRKELATCLPFLLEAGYSARSATEHQAMMADFDLLPYVPITTDVESSARRAQRELAVAGHHRLSPTDIVIAACAHESGAGVLHYDRDYDLLTRYTTLAFDSEWISPPGSL